MCLCCDHLVPFRLCLLRLCLLRLCLLRLCLVLLPLRCLLLLPWRRLLLLPLLCLLRLCLLLLPLRRLLRLCLLRLRLHLVLTFGISSFLLLNEGFKPFLHPGVGNDEIFCPPTFPPPSSKSGSFTADLAETSPSSCCSWLAVQKGLPQHRAPPPPPPPAPSPARPPPDLSLSRALAQQGPLH